MLYYQSYFASKTNKKIDLKKFKKLSANDFSTIKFTLDSSCILFASKFAIFSIWQKEQKIINILNPEFAAVYGFKIFPLSEVEFLFLSQIQKQKPLYKIYQVLCKKIQKDVDIGALINRFISDEVIVKFDL